MTESPTPGSFKAKVRRNTARILLCITFALCIFSIITPGVFAADYKLPTPDGFTWTDSGVNIYLGLNHSFYTDYNVANHENYSGVTYYVNYATGSDSNNGLTSGTALQNVNTAITKSDVGTVIVAGGQTYSFKHGLGVVSTLTLARNITIKSDGAVPATFSCYDGSMVWSLAPGQTNTYMAARTLTGRTFDAKFTDAHGDYKELTYVANGNVATVEATPGSWCNNSSYIWVHTEDNRVPDLNIRPYFRSGPLTVVTSPYSVTLENINFEGGGNPFSAYTNTEAPIYVYSKDCTFKYGYDVGCSLRGNVISYFQNCTAANNLNDGFSLHIYAGTSYVPKSVEIGCTGRDNGNTWLNSARIINGGTEHDGSTVIRLNGLYTRNFGPNLADVGGVSGSQSWIVNCTALASTAPLGDNGYDVYCGSGGGTSHMWLDTATTGGPTYIYAYSGDVLHQYNTTLIATANFTASNTTGFVPFTVEFNSSFSTNLTSATIDFGDGSFGTFSGSTITHTYTRPGYYNVVVYAANDAGQSRADIWITVMSGTGSFSIGDLGGKVTAIAALILLIPLCLIGMIILKSISEGGFDLDPFTVVKIVGGVIGLIIALYILMAILNGFDMAIR